MQTLIILISFIRLLMTFPVDVAGGSMIPTFYDGDTVYANTFDTRFGDVLSGIWFDGFGAGLNSAGGGVNSLGVDRSDIGVKRGDVIVFRMPGFGAENYYYVKRVIGLPGDEVVIKNGSVFVDGKALNEPYLRAGEITQVSEVAGGFGDLSGGSTTGDAAGALSGGGVSITSDGKGFVYNVPKGKYFVLGDNRENSIDSRNFVDIFVSKKNVKGKYLSF